MSATPTSAPTRDLAGPSLRVIPVLLMRNGGLWKGVRFREHKYVGDPMNAVRIFNEKKADEMMLLDIDAHRAGVGPDPELVRKIADESYMPFAIGGGIQSVKQMANLVKAGAEKICISTAAVENPPLIAEAGMVLGRQSVVVSIDFVRDFLGRYRVSTRAGSCITKLDAYDWARRAEDMGAGELMLNDISRDGTGHGYDLDFIKRICGSVGVPVISCGGAGSVDDLVSICATGASAAAAGSMFVFHGKMRAVLITYPEGKWRRQFMMRRG